MRRGLSAALIAASAVLAGCGPGATAATPTPIATPTIAATIAPTVAATIEPPLKTPGPTPTVFLEVTKNAEGAHGGPPALDLSGAIAIEYTFDGHCSTTISVATTAGALHPQKLTLEVDGHESGQWSLTLPVGTYYVGPDESVGCTYHLVVRAA
jgi:hypothetical protein